MQTSIHHLLATAVSAAVCLSFAPAPTVAVSADATWEAVTQGPQGPKKVAEDTSITVSPLLDAAQAHWPGLRTVGGLGSLTGGSRSGGSLTGGSGGGAVGSAQPADPVSPEPPPSPRGRLVPPAPVEPLSPFMP